MKCLIFIFFSLTITAAVKAQLVAQESLQLHQHRFNKNIYNKLFLHHYNIPEAAPYNSVLKIPAPLLTYKGNTKGFEIYQSGTDNMFVAKPDSSVAFNMPVKQFAIQFEPIK
ncbi:MAG: hypothetical protein ABJB05_16465 [Parafilimonas sp.]